MHISFPLLLLLLLLLIGSTSTLKQGDFGLFTACIFNKSLRLYCFYAPCLNSPPFDCEIMTSDGRPLSNPSRNCTLPLTLPRHRELHSNTTTSYNCMLTRKGRKEEKRITIDYSVRKGRKGHIKACKVSSGVRRHRAPDFLWPVAVLTLWIVLGTDGRAA